MVFIDWAEISIFILLLVVATPLLGQYMVRVFNSQQPPFRYLSGVESGIYALCGVEATHEMDWVEYLKAMLLLSALGLSVLFMILIAQGILPFNPLDLPGLEWSLALNIAVSFVSNTNWQSYAGEITLSPFAQTVGLGVQNFLSAAIGNAVLLALIRGFVRTGVSGLGNFWVDVTRTILYLLLPLAVCFALIFVSQGVVQTLSASVQVTALEQGPQTIPLGPVASFESIKLLGANGGGYFNANSAHPFENPTPLSNFFEAFAIMLIPAATTYMYGCSIGSRKSGWILFGVMACFWLGALALAIFFQSLHNPLLPISPILEGQELRFGTSGSVLWAITTTTATNGSVNAMLSSLSPLAGGVAMFNIMIGESIFGGVGAGMATMVMYILLTVFLAGLMVGRTPEYLGKKIDKSEMCWVMLALLTPGALILIGSGVTFALPFALKSLSTRGPHGFTEMLYTFSSTSGNNGSAFGGFAANTPYYNLLLALCMLGGRLAILIPSIVVAGSLLKKKILANSFATFSTDTGLFALVLSSVLLTTALLSFFPVLALGPILEQIALLRGKAF